MPYCTAADVALEVGGQIALDQLTDLDGDGTSPDAGVIDAAIAEADAKITSYAKKRWKPDSIPLTIKSVSVRMTARALRGKKGTFRQHDADQELLDIRWLEALAKGDVTAADEAAEKSSLVMDTAGERTASVREVSRERLKGFW